MQLFLQYEEIVTRECDAPAETLAAATCRSQARELYSIGLWTLGRCLEKLGRSLALPTAIFIGQLQGICQHLRVLTSTLLFEIYLLSRSTSTSTPLRLISTSTRPERSRIL